MTLGIHGRTGLKLPRSCIFSLQVVGYIGNPLGAYLAAEDQMKPRAQTWGARGFIEFVSALQLPASQKPLRSQEDS